MGQRARGHRLQDGLGIRTEYKSQMGTYDQGIHKAVRAGRILQKTHASYVMRKPAQEINKNTRRLGERSM
eukprot:jgi/Antlo1/1045/1103